MPSPPSLFAVLSAFPGATAAETAARALVEEGLAACVQVLPGLRSFYRWEGRLETADETLVIAKTAGVRLEALIARLRELHPYELPEIVAVEAGAGLPAYIDWVAAETREEP